MAAQHHLTWTYCSSQEFALHQLMNIPGVGQTAVCIYIQTYSYSYQAVSKSDRGHLQTILRRQTAILNPPATSAMP